MAKPPLRSRARARLTRLLFDIAVSAMWLGRRPAVASVRMPRMATSILLFQKRDKYNDV